jgi:hypothetical protein
MSENLKVVGEKMEFPKCEVICIANGIGDEAHKKCLCQFTRSLNII